MKPLLLVIWGWLFAVVSLQAAPLSYQTHTIEAKVCHDKTKDKRCHGLTVNYPITGDNVLDTWAAQTIKKNVGVSTLSHSAIQARLAKDEDVQYALQKNIYCALDYLRGIELVGQTVHYAILGEETWEYTCGAHGNGSHKLFVFKRGAEQAQPISLAEIVLPNQMAKLAQLQQAAYLAYLQTQSEMSEQEARHYIEQYNPTGFTATENWRLGKEGLVFLFQTYEIGAYVLGRPELWIATQDLQGIIRPEILHETLSYTSKP